MDDLKWLFRFAIVGMILVYALIGVGLIAGVAGLLWWLL